MSRRWVFINLIKCVSCIFPAISLAQTVQAPSQTGTMPQPSTNKQNTNELSASMLEALQAAQDFVQAIDQGAYSASWTKGDDLFKKAIGQSEWTRALQLARAPLGRVSSRTFKDERPAWDPRGLPKGAYMVVEYSTSFEKAQNSGEILTLRQGADGKWRVLTYQVN